MPETTPTLYDAAPITAEAKSGEPILAWGPNLGHRVVFYDDSNSTNPWAQEDGDRYRKDAFTIWWKLPEVDND